MSNGWQVWPEPIPPPPNRNDEDVFAFSVPPQYSTQSYTSPINSFNLQTSSHTQTQNDGFGGQVSFRSELNQPPQPTSQSQVPFQQWQPSSQHGYLPQSYTTQAFPGQQNYQSTTRQQYPSKQQSHPASAQSYQPPPLPKPAQSYQPPPLPKPVQSYQPPPLPKPVQSYQPPPQPQQSYQPPPQTQQSYQPPPKLQQLPQAQYQRSSPPSHQLPKSQPLLKSLGQHPSLDTQMFQSLQSNQFESQGSNHSQQSQSSYSPQSTQVRWSSQSPSTSSQSLSRNGSLSLQQPSLSLQQPSLSLQQPSLQQTRPTPTVQTGMSPQLQRPSHQLHTGLSPQLQQQLPKLQTGLSPQLQQRPSPQMSQRAPPQVQRPPQQVHQRLSPQVQHRPSPQQRPSPQVQHHASPQFASPQFASPQNQLASPPMPVKPSPQLHQLAPPHSATQQISPQSYLPQHAPQQQQFDFQQYLPPPAQPQQSKAYQQDVPKFDMAQWEQSLQQSLQQPVPMSHKQQQQPPSQPQPQQPVPLRQQAPQQASQQHYSGYNGFGGPEQYGLATPSSSRIQGEAIKIAAPSPTMHTTTIPPPIMTHPTPSPSQSSSFTTPSYSQQSNIPKPSSKKGNSLLSSTSQSIPSKRKSQASHAPPRSPQPPTQPSSRPQVTTTTEKVMPVPVSTVALLPTPLPETIPTGAFLFHTAVSAHHNATYHLQQVFVPQEVKDGDKGGMKRETALGRVLFTHDPDALNTALRLLVMALDLLRIGFYMPNLSDSERAAFGLEFATVAAKVLATEDPVKKLLTKEELARVRIVIDHKRLASDVDDVMTKTLAAARSPHLKHYRQRVELVSARLAFMKDKANHAKRIIKQALAATPREDVAHRYNLNLLHMNHLLKASNVELLQVVKEFEADARAHGHMDVVLLAHIIRIRAHFSLRRWDNLLAMLDESEALFGTNEVFTSGDPTTTSFRLVLLMHYLNMRALYHGRAADDANAKKQLSRLYPLMDHAMEKGMLSELRSSGGMVTIPLPVRNGSTQQLFVQSTPINVLWALTYLSSVVARRDLLGSLTQCRTLNHTRAMRQFELCAHPDDLWDSGFSFRHGVAEALELRHKVNKLRAEVMMEEALALMCRSSFEDVTTLLSKTVKILHDNKLFLTHSHQLALLYGHLMHAIGLPDQAVRYYKAAQSLLVAGSEMRLIVDINLMAAQGGFSNLLTDLDRSAHVNIMADQCRAGTNGALNAIGYFLLSLTDPERVSSKRKLTFSYEVCRKGKLNILYALIFAFTTAQHLFGDRDRQLKQLESGRDIARLLGGKDRADGCGQLPLGLWYSTKLRDHYRLDGRFDDEKAAAADAECHLHRMQEVYAYGCAHFPPRIPI